MNTEHRFYDALMRLPIVSFTLFFLVREMIALRELVAARPHFEEEWHFVVTVAARVSVMMFLVLLATLHLSRHRPVRKYATWEPKVTALLGLLIVYPLILVPRADTDTGWDTLSAILLLCGNTLCIIAVLDLGRSLSIMPEARQLVTTGIYRRIRHPLYLAEDIAFLGIFLQFRSWAAAVVLLATLLVQLRRMDWEEGILSGMFPEYAEYQRRSYRLLPGLY
jgi:protein-S-isoprenylcysteine O-methyltransferase Ste14